MALSTGCWFQTHINYVTDCLSNISLLSSAAGHMPVNISISYFVLFLHERQHVTVPYFCLSPNLSHNPNVNVSHDLSSHCHAQGPFIPLHTVMLYVSISFLPSSTVAISPWHALLSSFPFSHTI